MVRAGQQGGGRAVGLGRARAIVLPALLLAASLAPRAPAADDAGLRDCQVTLRARRVLLQDETLAPLNLGVSVRDGSAAVWGLVPTPELADRAVERVRRVPGILEVRRQISVVRATDPMLEHLSRPASQGDEFPVAALNRPPAALASRAPAVPPTRLPADGIAVMPAITLPGPSSPPAAAAATDLFNAVERLRRGPHGADPRYLRVHTQVQGGVVRLGGTVHRWEDLFELARKISHLPGVERVVLENVRAVP
jgi:hypothetical protein